MGQKIFHLPNGQASILGGYKSDILVSITKLTMDMSLRELEECYERQMSNGWVEGSKEELFLKSLLAAKYENELSNVVRGPNVDAVLIRTEADVIKPPHYKAGEFDVIAFCHHHEVNFSRGTAIKYLVRAGKKPGESELRDLNKAIEFLTRERDFILKNQEPG